MPQPDATTRDVGDYFIGVLIPVRDIAGRYNVPGWRCRGCGWTVGSTGYPPDHKCETVDWKRPRKFPSTASYASASKNGRRSRTVTTRRSTRMTDATPAPEPKRRS